MTIITLAEAKLHLRVQHNLEDTTIQIYIDAAGDYIGKFLNNPAPAPTSAIKAAALLIVGDLFENRSAQIDKQLYKNNAAESLLYPYRENIGI